MERLFKTADNNNDSLGLTINNTFDLDWELQKYSVTTGWKIPAIATTAPAA